MRLLKDFLEALHIAQLRSLAGHSEFLKRPSGRIASQGNHAVAGDLYDLFNQQGGPT
jgi:hypothetical protein